MLDQNGKPSDLNDGAGGDYIYLLITRDKEDAKNIASMIGDGSAMIVIALFVVSVAAIAGVCVCQKKRRVNVESNADAASEDETSD